MADKFTENEQPVAAIVLRSSSGRRLGLWILLAIAGLLFLGLIAAWPVVLRTFNSYKRRLNCSQQLHKIGVALQNYYDEYGVYPPAIAYDAGGRPMHSWRVLILPHLGQAEEKLYKRYRLDEPWDGPNNRALADEMPRVYACPVDPGAVDAHTSYLALVNAANGKFAAQPPTPNATMPNPTTPVDKLVVEVAESGVVWLEPKDLMLGATSASAGQPDLPDRFSYHIDGSHLLKDDGDCVLLTVDKLRAALEAAGRAIAPAAGGGP